MGKKNKKVDNENDETTENSSDNSTETKKQESNFDVDKLASQIVSGIKEKLNEMTKDTGNSETTEKTKNVTVDIPVIPETHKTKEENEETTDNNSTENKPTIGQVIRKGWNKIYYGY